MPRMTAARFTHVINIGIGGSDLGPVMVHEALAASRLHEEQSTDVRFVSNVDPSHLDSAHCRFGSGQNLIGDCVQDLHNARNYGQCAPRLGLAQK